MSYEKYMSAPEFVALRPLPGNAVLSKALLYADEKVREMAFFLQALSMQPGGLREVAEQLVSWYPERCREDESHDACVLRFAQLLEPETGTREDTSKSLRSRTAILLGDRLIELALNPQRSLSDIGASCFQDLGSALAEYKKLHEKKVLDGFVPTTAGTIIREALDQALNLKKMVIAEGASG